jgi:hypothetical protein
VSLPAGPYLILAREKKISGYVYLSEGIIVNSITEVSDRCDLCVMSSPLSITDDGIVTISGYPLVCSFHCSKYLMGYLDSQF